MSVTTASVPCVVHPACIARLVVISLASPSDHYRFTPGKKVQTDNVRESLFEPYRAFVTSVVDMNAFAASGDELCAMILAQKPDLKSKETPIKSMLDGGVTALRATKVRTVKQLLQRLTSGEKLTRGAVGNILKLKCNVSGTPITHRVALLHFEGHNFIHRNGCGKLGERFTA